MKGLKQLCALVIIALSLSACATTPYIFKPSEDLADLADYMIGFFSSLEQSTEDPEYFDIHLHIIRIWPEQKNGYWLYVEKAVAGRKPFQQQIYHLTEPTIGRFECKVMELKNPDTYIGAWNDQKPFGNISPKKLKNRPGCTIFLTRETDGIFKGGTHDTNCKSTKHGATYATSQLKVSTDILECWDRGYNAKGKQVSGAIKSAYIFNKLQNYPPD
ncbi:chromophore lyase CpcT/CpeT [bacterium]|nr:chromophore lyase CpcT/CpeT [bacterium]